MASGPCGFQPRSRIEAFREQYMAPDNVLKFSHGRTWEAPANYLGDKAGEIEAHSSVTELNLQDIAAGKVEVVFLAVSKVTADMNSQMERMLFETMFKERLNNLPLSA